MSSIAFEEKDDERKTMLIKGIGTPAEEKEEVRKEQENAAMVDSEHEKHGNLKEATLKPVTKVNSKLDKELQEWEVE